MGLNRSDLESIHKFSDNHRELLDRSDRAGCFYCGSMFAPGDVLDWVDGLERDSGETTTAATALCPRCGIDAVLPSAAPIPLTQELLDEMRRHWFDK